MSENDKKRVRTIEDIKNNPYFIKLPYLRYGISYIIVSAISILCILLVNEVDPFFEKIGDTEIVLVLLLGVMLIILGAWTIIISRILNHNLQQLCITIQKFRHKMINVGEDNLSKELLPIAETVAESFLSLCVKNVEIYGYLEKVTESLSRTFPEGKPPCETLDIGDSSSIPPIKEMAEIIKRHKKHCPYLTEKRIFGIKIKK